MSTNELEELDLELADEIATAFDTWYGSSELTHIVANNPQEALGILRRIRRSAERQSQEDRAADDTVVDDEGYKANLSIVREVDDLIRRVTAQLKH